MPVDRPLAADLADELVATYAEIEQRLAVEMAARLRAGLDSPDWAKDKLAAIGSLRKWTTATVRRLSAKTGQKTARALEAAFERGGAEALNEIAATKRGNKARRAQDLQGVRKALPGVDTLHTLTRSLVGRLEGTHLPILRWAEDAYRTVVAKTALVDVSLGLAARRAASQRAWSELLAQGVTGFTDKAGRNWNLATYVEMATRTGAAQAAVEGHMAQLGKLGVDLVIVSNAPQECIRCRPWEGKVLSRGGPAGRRTVDVEHATRDGEMVQVQVAGSVDEAIAAGLLHPNCRHNLSAYLPGLTRTPTNTEDPDGDAARQKLRALERKVRAAKLQQAAAIDPATATAAGAKVRALQAEIRDHVTATEHLGIRRKSEREQLNLGNTTGSATAAKSTATSTTAAAAKPAAPPKKTTPPPAPVVPPPAPPKPSLNPAEVTGPDKKWWRQLQEDTPAGTYVPVRDLELEPGYTVQSGRIYRVNGIAYLVEDGTNSSHENVLRGFQDIHRELGPDASKYQHSYAWLKGRNPADAYWEKQYGIPGFLSAATAGDSSTRTWNASPAFIPSNYLDRFMHEFGHNVSTGVQSRGLHDTGYDYGQAVLSDRYVQRPSDLRWALGRLALRAKTISFTPDHSKNLPWGVSTYGKSSHAEDYAESIAFYLGGHIAHGRLTPGGPEVPIYFRDLFPARAAIFDQIFPDVARKQLAAISARS
jgi:hypothetical protein